MAPEELAEYVVGFLVMLNLGSPPILVRGIGEAVGEVLRDRGYKVFSGVSLEEGLKSVMGMG